jgi:hypothetical protein
MSLLLGRVNQVSCMQAGVVSAAARHPRGLSVRIKPMRILSGYYGVRILSNTVHYIPCIKIGDNFFTKKTLKVFRLLTGCPSRVPVNPYHYKVLNNFLCRSIAETIKF